MNTPALLSRVPARLRPHVTDIYRDSDGLWIEGDRYFWNPVNDSHTVHEDNWAQARVILRECKVLADEAAWTNERALQEAATEKEAHNA